MKLFRLAILTLVLCSSNAFALAQAGRGTWETSLQARDLNGDGLADAFYDKSLDITWLANWNVSAGLDTLGSTDSNECDNFFAQCNGRLSWNDALQWADGLNVFGVTGWRLPKQYDNYIVGCDYSIIGGTNCGYNTLPTSSEMSHLFHLTLGNKGYYDAQTGLPQEAGWGLSNTAGFVNMQDHPYSGYWSGSEYSQGDGDDRFAWVFDLPYGQQSPGSKSAYLYAVAVRDGDVNSVPEPTSLALLSSILFGLVIARAAKKI